MPVKAEGSEYRIELWGGEKLITIIYLTNYSRYHGVCYGYVASDGTVTIEIGRDGEYPLEFECDVRLYKGDELEFDSEDIIWRHNR